MRSRVELEDEKLAAPEHLPNVLPVECRELRRRAAQDQ